MAWSIGILGLVNCSPDGVSAGDPALEVVRYDSAGVEIVEAGPGTLERPLDWTISASPLVIGGDPEDARYQFLGVAGVVELTDGRIAVADRRDQQVRVYSDTGVFERAVGGEGGGPGEFSFVSGLERGPGDSLVVVDLSQRRATWFGPDGGLGRATQFPAEIASFYDFDLRSDGGWFVGERRFGGSPGPEEVSRDTVRYLTLDREMTETVEIGREPGSQTAGVATQIGNAMTRAPLTPLTLADPHLGCLVVSAADLRELKLMGPAGLVRKVGIEGVLPTVTGWLREAWFDYFRTTITSEEWDLSVDGLQTIPFPEFLPWANDLHVDPLGFVWVERFEPPNGPSRDWFVFAPSGEPLGTIALPEALDVFEVGTDYVLGVRVDDFEEEFVVRYGLVRPERLQDGAPPPACEP